MSEKKNEGLFVKIIVPVIIALAVGGSAPWWWPGTNNQEPVKEVGSTDPPKSPETSEELPAVQPSSDFTGGSKRIYSADFSTWPTKTSEHGSVSLGFGNSYVLEPFSNTWIGPGHSVDIPPLNGDFVFDVRFKILEASPSSILSFRLTGGGTDAESVEVIFSIWDKGSVTYTLTKGRIRSGSGLLVPHVITEETVAERQQLPLALIQGRDWSKGSTLTLKREGGRAQFFVNSEFINEFGISQFAPMKTSVGAAFKSRVLITSIEARTRN